MAATVADGSQREASGAEEPVGVRILTYVVAVLVGALVVWVLTTNATIRSSLEPELIIWALLACLGGLATVRLGADRPSLSMDLPVLLACSFVMGPVPAGLVAMFGAFDQQEIRGEVRLTRLIWNHVQTALSVMAGGAVFHLVGGLQHGIPTAMAAACLALVADAAVNYASVSVLLSLATKRPLAKVIVMMSVGPPLGFTAMYAAFGLMSLLIALAFRQFGSAGVLLFVAPLLLGREAFSQRFLAESAAVTIDTQQSALVHVDERIADERRDERARIAAALHDDVLQCLYNVTIRAQVIREDFRSGRLLDLEGDVPPLISASEQAADELRDVIRGLRRSTIGHAGLIDTITLLIRHLENESTIKFVLELDPSTRADASLELLAYQISREALTNAVKHSGAQTVWCEMSMAEGAIHIEVVDDGVGFDVTAPRDARHFGLDLMSERAKSMGGSVEIRSSTRGGTTVIAKLPLSLA